MCATYLLEVLQQLLVDPLVDGALEATGAGGH